MNEPPHDGADPDATKTTPAGTGADRPVAPHPRRIGPYRIVSVLGSGGMGVVYLAEQDQPLRRFVALKLIRAGMDSESPRFSRRPLYLRGWGHGKTRFGSVPTRASRCRLNREPGPTRQASAEAFLDPLARDPS